MGQKGVPADRFRVMYLLPAERFGGAERQGVMSILHLGRSGLEVLPVVGPGPLIGEALHREGVDDFVFADYFPDDVTRRKGPLGTAERVLKTVRGFRRSRRALIDLLNRHPCDVIYATRTFSWFVAGFLSRKTGIPAVWRCGSRITSPFLRLLVRGFIRWSRPAALVVTCEAMRDSFGPNPGAPTFVLWHSVDAGRFHPSASGAPLREKLGIPARAQVIGIAARPAPEKGPAFIADILARVTRTNDRALLVWAGESRRRAEVEAIFGSRGLSEAVRFPGHIADIEQFYAMCDVVVLGSRSNSIETTPNALLEPMAMAKPVVGTKAGGIPEIVTDGSNGFVVDEEDVSTFAERILLLLSDKALADRMGRAAREAILRNHDPATNVARLAEILRAQIHSKAV